MLIVLFSAHNAVSLYCSVHAHSTVLLSVHSAIQFSLYCSVRAHRTVLFSAHSAVQCS